MPLIRDLVSLYNWIQDPDKAKREFAQRAILEDPARFQALTNSSIADDPNALQSLFGKNARWGSNSNASTNLANLVSSAPLSETEKASRINDLGNANINDIANAGVKLPQFRAFNGVSPTAFQNQIPQITGAMQGNAQPPVSMLSEGQAALLPENIAKLKAQGDKARLGVDTSLTTKNLAETGEANERAKELQARSDADKIVSDFYSNNPGFSKTSPHDLFFTSNPLIPQEVKNAIPISNKYGKAFETQFTKNLEDLRAQSEKDRVGLETDRLKFDRETQQNMFTRQAQMLAGSAWKDSGYIGGNDGYKGFTDIYSGKPTTPEAMNVVKNAGAKVREGMIEKYNSSLTKLLSEESKLPDDAKVAAVDAINQQAAGLEVFGIYKDPLAYGERKTFSDGIVGTAQRVGNFFSGQKYITTTTGGVPSVVSTSNSNEPSADDIIKLIQSGKATLSATLKDPEVSPKLRAEIIKKLNTAPKENK